MPAAMTEPRRFPTAAAAFAMLAGWLAGRPATACSRLAQKFSTAAVTDSATIRWRSGVASSSLNIRYRFMGGRLAIPSFKW